MRETLLSRAIVQLHWNVEPRNDLRSLLREHLVEDISVAVLPLALRLQNKLQPLVEHELRRIQERLLENAGRRSLI